MSDTTTTNPLGLRGIDFLTFGGHTRGYLGNFINRVIGVIREQMIELRELSQTDPLTRLANRRRFAKLTDAQGKPDGAAVDSEGHYWVAAIDSGQVLRYCPTGVLDRAVAVPTRWPTMPAFGGRDMRTVFVTSLKTGKTPEELAASPESGGLFAFEADAPGLVEPRFAG